MVKIIIMTYIEYLPDVNHFINIIFNKLATSDVLYLILATTL